MKQVGIFNALRECLWVFALTPCVRKNLDTKGEERDRKQDERKGDMNFYMKGFWFGENYGNWI